jgi:hypothetical protein
MNTPRTRERRRYAGFHPPVEGLPSGSYRLGIWNDEFLLALGRIATYWPHVEDAMVMVLHDLIGRVDFFVARQIFRSIIANEARRKVMTALLEKTALNRNKPQAYDDILHEFYKLNGTRNDYVHGLWFTFEDGRVYLAEQLPEELNLASAHLIDIKDIRAVQARMEGLHLLIDTRNEP